MIFKVLIITLLLAVIISLGVGLFGLLRDPGNSTRTVKALTIRITLSLLLFLLLIIGLVFGFITPHDVGQ